MTIFNDEERKAGTLILSQFKMFNEASAFFAQYIDPVFFNGFDNYFKQIAERKNWVGEYEFNKKSCIWFSPKNWQLTVNEEKTKEWKYWFETYYLLDDEIDYRLSMLTNTSSKQSMFGIRFTVNSGWIGGNRCLNEFSKNISDHHINQLQKLGLTHQGKGNFFIPLKLEIEQIAACWEEFASFSIEHDVFKPIDELMDKLEKSSTIFDEIFSTVNPAQE